MVVISFRNKAFNIIVLCQEAETQLKYKIRPIRDSLQDVYKLQISFIKSIKYTQKYYDISLDNILKSVFFFSE